MSPRPTPRPSKPRLTGADSGSMVISIPPEIAERVPLDMYFQCELTAKGILFRPLGAVTWID